MRMRHRPSFISTSKRECDIPNDNERMVEASNDGRQGEIRCYSPISSVDKNPVKGWKLDTE